MAKNPKNRRRNEPRLTTCVTEHLGAYQLAYRSIRKVNSVSAEKNAICSLFMLYSGASFPPASFPFGSVRACSAPSPGFAGEPPHRRLRPSGCFRAGVKSHRGANWSLLPFPCVEEPPPLSALL